MFLKYNFKDIFIKYKLLFFFAFSPDYLGSTTLVITFQLFVFRILFTNTSNFYVTFYNLKPACFQPTSFSLALCILLLKHVPTIISTYSLTFCLLMNPFLHYFLCTHSLLSSAFLFLFVSLKLCTTLNKLFLKYSNGKQSNKLLSFL